MKTQLINAICRLCPKLADRSYLKTRTVAQLRETLARQRAIAGVTAREIAIHCQFDELPDCDEPEYVGREASL